MLSIFAFTVLTLDNLTGQFLFTESEYTLHICSVPRAILLKVLKTKSLFQGLCFDVVVTALGWKAGERASNSNHTTLVAL